MRTRGFLTNDYKRVVNLKVAALFAILLLSAFGMSILIAESSTLRVFAAIVGVILLVVMFFYPQMGLMLLLFVIPFEEVVSYPLFKIIALVFLISWLARKSITREQIHFSVKYPQAKYLIGVVFALVLSLLFSIDKADSLMFFQRFILLIALYVFLVDSIRSPKDLRNLGWLIGFSGGLASLAGLMQYYVFHTGILNTSQSFGLIEKYHGIGIKEEGVRIAGFTGNPNEFAVYLVVSICFLLYCFSMTRNLILRILIMILIGCSIASIVFTLSRTGVLTLVVVTATYAVRFKGFKFTSILLLLAIGLGLIFFLKFAPDFIYNRLIGVTFHEKDVSTENRVTIIKKSIDLFLEHPNILITGVGLDNFPKVAWHHRDAHNTFLQMLAETGLIGFAFFSLLTYRSYRDVWHGIKLKQVELQLFCLASFAAFTVILLAGLVGTLTYNKHLWLLFALAPILYNIRRKGHAPA
jgi:O-antigen ligase